jgi:hypothetical protein
MNNNLQSNVLISQDEFERIFQVIHSVYNSIENNTEPNCLFYNLAGSFLLNYKYNIPAKPVIGGAVFSLLENPRPKLLIGLLSETLYSDKNHFHCWVETDSHIFDFTSPLYSWYFRKEGYKWTIPKKMFQKKYSDMNSDLSKVGDFLLKPNRQLTAEIVKKGLNNKTVMDLINICIEWYTVFPQKIEPSMKIFDDQFIVKNIDLQNIKLTGYW